MKRLQILFTTGIVTTLLVTQGAIPASAYDLGGKGVLTTANQWQNQASRAADRQQNELQNSIHRADTMITNRITTLNTLNTRLQNDSKLSSSEKSSLSADIQADITGLTTLKAKIDADTDLTTARADIKQIVTSYYVYALFEPKIRLLITLNNLQTATANVQALVPQIQNLINTLQSHGKDVSALQSLLTDVSGQLQTITATLNSDLTTIQAVTTTSGDPRSIFTKVRQDLAQIVRSGFAKIRSDFAQMRPLFHQLIFNKPSSALPISSTPTVTANPTATSTAKPTSTL